MMKRVEENLELYRALRDYIDHIGFGIARVEDEGDSLAYLGQMFDEEDARHFIATDVDLDTPENVAKKMGRAVRDVSDKLYDMSKRGLLFREKVDGQLRYRTVPLLHGVVEFNVNRHTREDLIAFTKIAPAMRNRYYDFEPFQRSMPISPDIVKKGDLLPKDDIRTILKSAEKIALANCICRTLKKQLGGDCKHTMQTCMAINSWADYYVENSDGKYITYEEALHILELCDGEGLSVHCANSDETEIICCCCPCCCGLIKSYTMFPLGGAVKNISNYIMVLDREKCIDCGICAGRCVMNALKMEEGKITYNAELCNGCGLCATTCPEQAAMLARKEKTYSPPGKTWFDTYKVMAEDRKQRGLL